MKILLIGDFSGAHYYLKLALEELGHRAVLYSNRDAYKQIPTEKAFYVPQNNEIQYIASLKVILSQLEILKELRQNYHIIQLISPAPFHHRINNWLVMKILRSGKPVVLFNAACSFPYNRLVSTLSYRPCEHCKRYDLPQTNRTVICPHETRSQQTFETYVYNKVSAIVSSHYEYYQAMKLAGFRDKNHLIPIPYPVNPEEVYFYRPSGRLKVYLGITRIGFKGVLHMLKAIEIIKSSRYSRFFQFIIRQRLPYEQHRELVRQADVLLDQTSTYSYGVNALVGLSLGKIVLSGAEPVALKEAGIEPEDCPIINIVPDASAIASKLIELLDMRNSWMDLQEKGIQFMLKYHNPVNIAKRYETLYNSLLT